MQDIFLPSRSPVPLLRRHRDQITVPLGLDLRDREPVLLVMERDALNQPGQAFGKWRWWRRLQRAWIVRQSDAASKWS